MPTPRRHHYLPKFLLAEFAISSRKREYTVRGINKQQGLFVANTNKVGLVKDFHAIEGIFKDAERHLSDRETEFATEMRSWCPGELSERGARIADELVWHLRLRSRILRTVLESALSQLGARLQVSISTELDKRGSARDAWEELALAVEGLALGRDTEKGPEEIRRKLRIGLTEFLTRVTALETSNLIDLILRDETYRELARGIQTHIVVLDRYNRKNREAFGKVPWQVIETDEELVLGDVGPLARHANSRTLGPLIAKSEPLLAVLLPIGPRRLLAASRMNRLRLGDVTGFNRTVCELSHDFVVSTLSEHRLQQLQPLLGSRAAEDERFDPLGLEPASIDQTGGAVLREIQEWVTRRMSAAWAPQEASRGRNGQ
jgi:hypothetical protein